MTVAAIFDCDGVLIDSAHVWRDTEGELCRRAGRPLTEEEQRTIVTMTIGEVGDFLHSRFDLGTVARSGRRDLSANRPECIERHRLFRL